MGVIKTKGMIIMPRIARKGFDTSFFHIMVQGINREYIFSKKEYKEKYINLIKRYELIYKLEVLAYCIMDNHAHMLIYAENIGNLSSFMHSINLMYGQYYNKVNKRVGYVFRDRYKSEPIYKQEYLLNPPRLRHMILSLR